MEKTPTLKVSMQWFSCEEMFEKGLGPFDMEAGDLVCIVPGTSVVLILRAVERETLLSSNIHPKEDLDRYTEFFHLIGDAYLHGCMNGEAFTAASRGPDREFVIA